MTLKTRDLRTRPLHTSEWPPAADATGLPGSQLLLDDGDRVFSDGEEWVGDLPAGCEILVPPFTELKKGWFEVGGITGLPGGRKLIANKFNIAYVVPNVLSWAIVDPTRLFLDAARTSPVTVSPSPVGGVTDASAAGNHWSQSVSGNRPEWFSYPVGAETRHRLRFGSSLNSILNVPFSGAGQGSCLVFYLDTAMYFPSDFTGLAQAQVRGSLDIQEMLFFDRPLTAEELLEFITEIQKLRPVPSLNLDTWPGAAGFGIDARQQYGWRGWNWITAFPFINTTGTTDFRSLWRDCSRLEAFPLIDTAAGTAFNSAWTRCSAMTSFPTLNMGNALTLGATGGGAVVEGAWEGCSGLTAFPIIHLDKVTNGARAWSGCSSLTSFPNIRIGTANAAATVIMDEAWRDCSGLTSFPASMDATKWTAVGGAWEGCSGLTSFPALDSSNWTLLGRFARGAWRFCSGLTSFPLMNFANVTSFRLAWVNCTGLTSFPAINSSNGTDFEATWSGCSGLTSFPLIDTSKGTLFAWTWNGCAALTSFPALDVSKGTNFTNAWRDNTYTSFPALNFAEGLNFTTAWHQCRQLTSFPAVTFPKATNFDRAWDTCQALATFPAGVFNGCPATNFSNAFRATNLTQASIDNILVSINSNGTSGGTFNQSGGSAPSATGQAAITAMRSRGWTVTVQGGF